LSYQIRLISEALEPRFLF